YTTTTCPWCTRAKDYLRQKGVPFQEKNIEHDRAAAQEVMQRSGQMGVPVITAGAEEIVGIDPPRLDRLAQEDPAPPRRIVPARRLKGGWRVRGRTGGGEAGAVHAG